METWIQPVITIILAIFGTGGAWTYLQKRADRKDTKRKMLMGLAHDRLVYLSLIYLDRGYVSKEEYENIHKYLFLPYKDLDGNGTVAHLVEKVSQLPIKGSIHFKEDSQR